MANDFDFQFHSAFQDGSQVKFLTLRWYINTKIPTQGPSWSISCGWPISPSPHILGQTTDSCIDQANYVIKTEIMYKMKRADLHVFVGNGRMVDF